MKLSAFAPLLLASAVLAAPRFGSNAVAARQAQVKRGLVDVCVGLDLDVKLLDILPGGKPLIAGHLDICLCLSVLPTFCNDHPVGQSVTKLLGNKGANDFFSNLINQQPSKQQCRYPDHCDPICDVKKPCGFNCKDGFVPDNASNPTQCICPAPNSVCNGVCGSFPHGCGSQSLHKKKRADSPPQCASGKTLCGVSDSSNPRAFDCVSTETDAESCGGCMAKNPFGVPTAEGKNCKAIEHVDQSSVKCISSTCVVSNCIGGFKVSASGDSCVL